MTGKIAPGENGKAVLQIGDVRFEFDPPAPILKEEVVDIRVLGKGEALAIPRACLPAPMEIALPVLNLGELLGVGLAEREELRSLLADHLIRRFHPEIQEKDLADARKLLSEFLRLSRPVGPNIAANVKIAGSIELPGFSKLQELFQSLALASAPELEQGLEELIRHQARAAEGSRDTLCRLLVQERPLSESHLSRLINRERQAPREVRESFLQNVIRRTPAEPADADPRPALPPQAPAAVHESLPHEFRAENGEAQRVHPPADLPGRPARSVLPLERRPQAEGEAEIGNRQKDGGSAFHSKLRQAVEKIFCTPQEQLFAAAVGSVAEAAVAESSAGSVSEKRLSGAADPASIAFRSALRQKIMVDAQSESRTAVRAAEDARDPKVQQTAGGMLKGQELLKRLDPLVRAVGEPALLLFPFAIQNFISKIELAFYPIVSETDDEEDHHQGKHTGGQRQVVHFRLSLPALGAIEALLRYDDAGILLDLTVEKPEAREVIESQFSKLRERLSARGYEDISMQVVCGRPREIKPDWVYEVCADGRGVIA